MKNIYGKKNYKRVWTKEGEWDDKKDPEGMTNGYEKWTDEVNV